MRILFVTSGLFEIKGGIARQNCHICKSISEWPDTSIDVLSLWDSGQVVNQRYLRLDSPRVNFTGFRGNKKRFAWSVISTLLAQKYDLCLLGLVNFIPLLLMPFLVKKQKYIVVVYGVDVWKTLSPLDQFLLNQARQILSISQFTANQMKAINRISRPKITLLPNALDPYTVEAISQGQAQANQAIFNKSTKNILTVSRLVRSEQYKGQDKLIQALPDVANFVPNVCYHIVGEGDWQPDLQRLAQVGGVADRVTFHGWVDEMTLQQCYRECDLFAMPSKGEGFGFVYLEAMFYGKAVLASNKDAGQEVVQHGVTGLTVDPDHHQAVVSGLIELLTNDELRTKMGQNGKALVEKEYTFAHFQKRLMTALQEALK